MHHSPLLSRQNTILPHLGSDIRPTAPVLPTLSALGVLDLARLWRDDPASALHLADSNARDHWDHVERRKGVAA